MHGDPSPSHGRPALRQGYARHVVVKGFAMTNVRLFLSTYSPILALAAVILILYAIAACVGFDLIHL